MRTVVAANMLVRVSVSHKNEYFDLLRTTQYSGGYVRWIKLFVNAVGQAAKQSAEQLMQYEQHIIEDLEHLMDIENLPKAFFHCMSI